MNIQNPHVYLPDKMVGLDAKIEQVRVVLEKNITWLDSAFHRAWRLQEKSGIGTIAVPKVMVSKEKEYMSMMPNDALGAYCWFIGQAGEEPHEWTPGNKTVFFSKDVDLIFYFNYRKIDQSRNYVFVEELKVEVLYWLNQLQGLVVNDIVYETVEEVYEGYSLEEINRDLFYYPYGGIKFSLTLSYKINCSI